MTSNLTTTLFSPVRRLHVADPSHAKSFYHANDLEASWSQAAAFAGPKGRIATIPDIVAARLASHPKLWKTWYTTRTAEFLGYSKLGRRILIVAHDNPSPCNA